MRTATLVVPRIAPPASLKRTKMRFVPGKNGTFPVPATKIPKVAVPWALTFSAIGPGVGPGGFTHWPVAEFV